MEKKAFAYRVSIGDYMNIVPPFYFTSIDSGYQRFSFVNSYFNTYRVVRQWWIVWKPTETSGTGGGGFRPISGK